MVLNHKTVLQNLSYMTILQVIILLYPFLTYPYLIRVLGKELYGLVIFAQSVVGYFNILVGFGFDMSATRQVSINRGNTKKLGEIISSVIIIKSFLIIISFIGLYFIINLLPISEDKRILFYLTMWMCIYDMVFPTWYFQGIEKMKFITITTLISRTFFFGLIFLLIKGKSDFLYIPIINGVGALISGFIASYIIFIKHKIRFIIPKIETIIFYIKDSFPIFISNLSINIYLSSNKIFIGTFIGMADVAFYDLAEKIVKLLGVPIQLIGQVLYPKISNERNMKFLRKSFYLTFASISFIAIITFIFSSQIIYIIGGDEMLEANTVLRILILGIFPITISLFFANLNLLPWNLNNEYLKARMFTSIIYGSIIGILYFTSTYSLVTLAITVVLTECITALLAIYYSNKNNINFLTVD